MAFRFSNLGPTVQNKPADAAAFLAAKIAEHEECSLTVAAAALEVDYRTLTRWLSKLLEAGYDVRTRALELRADARVMAQAAGQDPDPLPAKIGRPFRPRIRASRSA